jgi:cytosine/adenosine deaminase-related metal-dependent hydrolase
MEFDAGPPQEFAEIFARSPNYRPYKEHFWYDWGPIFYRGRLDGSARVLCVASDPGPTERVAMRTLVGDAGQRVQGFLAKIGLTRSYVCLNAFIYALHPSSFWEGREILRDPEHLRWRNELFDKVKGPDPTNLQAIVAFGAQAQDAVGLWEGKGNLPVFEVPHPSSRDAQRLLDAWREAVTRLRELVTPDPEADPSPPNYGSQFREEDYSRVPPGDLPFGVPDWFGDDTWGRAATPRHNNSVSRPSPDDGHTLIWVAPRTTEFAFTSPAGPASPVGPLLSARYALEGRVVTMDASSTLLERGTVYVDGDSIAAVVPTGAASPPGFEGVTPVATGGTIYPGLMDLHNHLSYDALTLWDVPKKYTNRDQWGREPDYRKLISGPMQVLGKTTGYPEAVVRYVECKCLLGGVATAQGISLSSNQGIQSYYRGVVRNVEDTDDLDLPEAGTRIADVEAEGAEAFLGRLRESSCLLLHLSEGTDERARQHFRALRMANGGWAITSALAGIHCAALIAEDFGVLEDNGGAMVWSPLSNLLLYGQTADIKAARDSGVQISIGSDWSPSGSKNLLGELKVARLVSAEQGVGFSDRELLAMATRNAAEILKWDKTLGSIEAGKRADMLVVYGRSGDAYARLLEASETAISLVVIDGVPRYGSERLMGTFGPGTERWRVGSAERVLNLAQQTANPVVGALRLSEARDRLREGMARLPELARRLEEPKRALVAEVAPQWSLVLDHEEPPGMTIRPHLPFDSADGPTAPRLADIMGVQSPLSQVLGPLELDPLTVADDPDFLDRLTRQRNLPDYLKEGLPGLF